MSDDRQQGSTPALVVIGAALLIWGLWLLMGRVFDFPPVLVNLFNRLRSADEAIALIVLGVAVVVFAQRRDHPNMPAKGTKLYRSRSDKWVGGVLGGLARYFSVDVTVLRLAFIALVFLLDIGAALVAYIVLWVVVPEEPESASASAATAPAQPPAWPQPAPPAAPPAPPAPESYLPPAPVWPTPVPPAPPAPPATPEPPAPEAPVPPAPPAPPAE